MRPRDVRANLSDAVVAGQHITRFIEGLDFERYAADRLLSSAVERQLEIVGESLSRALAGDPSLAERLPEARRAIGLRNILAHGYDRVSDALVWSTVTESLPGLLSKIEPMIGRTPKEEDCR